MTSRNWTCRPRKSLASSRFLNLIYVCTIQLIQAFVNLNPNNCIMHTKKSDTFVGSLCTELVDGDLIPAPALTQAANQLTSWWGGVLVPLQYFSHNSFWRTDIILPGATQHAPRLRGKCRMRKTILQESLQQGYIKLGTQTSLPD